MWFAVAISVAAAEAVRDILFSHPRFRKSSPFVLAWLMTASGIPLLAQLFLLGPLRAPAPEFWWLVVVQSVVLGSSYLLFMYALTRGPLLQIQPLLALSSIFLIVTTPILSKDSVTTIGWVGVASVGAGVYLVSHPGGDGGGYLRALLLPLRQIVRDPAARAMVAVAALFAVNANLDRMTYTAAGGPWYACAVNICMGIYLGVVLLVLRARRHPFAVWPQGMWSWRLALGCITNAAMFGGYVWAITLAPMPVAVTIKRLAIFMSAGWGYAVRNERHAVSRPFWLWGIAATAVGIFLISLYGRG